MSRSKLSYKVVEDNLLKPSYSMDFELTMRLFFGDKAYHIADEGASIEHVSKWVKKITLKLKRDISRLDTTERHKQMLLLELGEIEKSISGKHWYVLGTVYGLLGLTGRMFGYDFLSGFKGITPIYSQSQNQVFWEKQSKGIGWEEIKKEDDNLIARRTQLICDLRKEGYSAYDISIIFATTEYAIKKVLLEATGK